MDGGSTDGTTEIIDRWKERLTGWRIESDNGQAGAVNEGVSRGSAPYVCWINSDDYFISGGLSILLDVLMKNKSYPMAYGKCMTVSADGKKLLPYLTAPFFEYTFANFCNIAQPATLIRREVWESVGGLDENLNMAFDYDLWWKIFRQYGKPKYIRETIAAACSHGQTKTVQNRREHYLESISVIRRYRKLLPLKWKLFWPIGVTLREWLKF